MKSASIFISFSFIVYFLSVQIKYTGPCWSLSLSRRRLQRVHTNPTETTQFNVKLFASSNKSLKFLCSSLDYFYFCCWFIYDFLVCYLFAWSTCNFNFLETGGCTKLIQLFQCQKNSEIFGILIKVYFGFDSDGKRSKKTTHACVRYKQQFSSCTQSKRYYPTRRLN